MAPRVIIILNLTAGANHLSEMGGGQWGEREKNE